jgi:hypothetical protein
MVLNKVEKNALDEVEDEIEEGINLDLAETLKYDK